MSFRLVLKSVTLNDLERRNGVILRCFSEFSYLAGALRESSRSLSHLLMSSCLFWVPASKRQKKGVFTLRVLARGFARERNTLRALIELIFTRAAL